MPLAVVFPGQGAATPGAGRAWRDDPAWHVVADAEATTGHDLTSLLLDADAAILGETWAGQLSVLLLSLMAWEAIADDAQAAKVGVFAGHSLGQITAAFASGLVDFEAGMKLAVTRADASRAAARRDPGRMAAVLGAKLDVVEELCAPIGDVWIAIDNAPGQIVIAGRPQALDEAIDGVERTGAGRARPLGVGHAFHTPLLDAAARAWHPSLDATPFHAPRHPIVTNHDALAHDDADDWPDHFARQLTARVRWRESQHRLEACGATRIVEVGPGRVLTGLAKRTIPGLERHHVSTPQDATRFAHALDAPVAVR